MKRPDKYKRRALIVRRCAVNAEQLALREAREQPVKEAKANTKRERISAAMKESWARRKRDAGIEIDETTDTEHAGSPDTELDKLDMLLGGPDEEVRP